MPDTPGSLLMQYQYDALDRLISSTPAGQRRQDRHYQNSQFSTEIQGEIQLQIFQGMGELLAERQKGSVQQTSLLITDKPRSVLQSSDRKFAYTPYGFCPVEEETTGRLGFNGERRDTSTGHYLLGNGHRAFNPILMRFNSPDSLSPFGKGGLNCYAYCGGDPVNRTDPTGKWYSMAWFTNAALGFVDDYLTRFIPKPLARLIPGVANRTFGQVASAMVAVTGFAGTVVYLAMNRIETAHPESPANDPIFFAYLTIGAVGFVSGVGLTLNKLARRPPRVPSPAPRYARARSLPNIGAISRSAPQDRLSGSARARSQSQPDLHHTFGNNVPKPVANTNLDRFNLRQRFDQGLFRPQSTATHDALSIRQR